MTSNAGLIIRDFTYNIVQDPDPAQLILKVNTLLIAGWFIVGGLGYGDGIYMQAMGIRLEDKV